MKKTKIIPLILLCTATQMAPLLAQTSHVEPIQYLNVLKAYNNNYSVPSEFGEQTTTYEYNSKKYVNYEKGCIELSGDGTYKVLAGKNANASGEYSFVAVDLLLADVANTYSSNAVEDPNLVIPRAERDYVTITSKFRTKYTEYYNIGFMIGTRMSDVKVWDGKFVTQDFAYGDGTFSFDSGRYNMSFLMYNQVKKAVYLLTNDQATIWNNNKGLGLPISDYGTMNVQLPGETSKRDVNLQLFEAGIIYENNGVATLKLGAVYDEDAQQFELTPSPTVPSEYGTYASTIEVSDSKTILVYQYGSIICNLNNQVYSYEFKPGRIYTDENTSTLIPLSYCLSSVGDEFGTEYTNEEHITTLLKAKYTELYNQGFFLGFKESAFQFNWNEVDAQQFKLGDSTASPWEGSRTNIAALVYNSAEDKIVLIKDNPLVAWNKYYNAFGAPTADSFEADGSTFQQFENGLLVIINNELDTAFLYNGTYSQYVKGKANYKLPYLGKKMGGIDLLWVYICVPAVVVAAGLSVVLVMIKKKKVQPGE